MTKGRLEAFSDGVIAIIITIMVLELRPPEGITLEALRPMGPIFAGYVLSFIFIGIYWNNHHHMLHAVKHVRGPVLWANLHLLFWLSIVPFATPWMGEHPFQSGPVAAYGMVLLACGCAYYILAQVLIKADGPDSAVARAIGSDTKGKLSVGIYVVAVGLAFVAPAVSCALYVVVALIWLVPDRRFEHHDSV